MIRNDNALIILAERIKMIRTGKNISVKKLSQSSGVSVTHIRDIERGKRSPSFTTLTLLSKALGVKLTYLIDTLSEGSNANDEESLIINLYRMLSPDRASLALTLLQGLVELK